MAARLEGDAPARFSMRDGLRSVVRLKDRRCLVCIIEGRVVPTKVRWKCSRRLPKTAV